MQQHNGNYRKASESIDRVYAFHLGDLAHTIIFHFAKIRKRRVISCNKFLRKSI